MFEGTRIDWLSFPLKDDGDLPSSAFPGGYPIIYICADDGKLCPDCANGKNGSEAKLTLDRECPDDDQWRIVAYYIHYEGPPEVCDHCNAEIESAYGDPEEEKGKTDVSDDNAGS